MSRPPTLAEQAAVRKVFQSLAQEIRNKELAKQHLLAIQLLIARNSTK
jgi:hypothetical protein